MSDPTTPDPTTPEPDLQSDLPRHRVIRFGADDADRGWTDDLADPAALAELRRDPGIDLDDPDEGGAADADGEGELRLTRSARRRLERDVIDDEAPREGVDIIRQVEVAIVVGVQLPGRTDADISASLDELEALLETAGGEVVARVVQKRDAPHAATYIGEGKVTELRDLARDLGADAVVFDDELAPAQQRNLEERIKQKVLDRTIVILDIFAQHATSREGKAQVELAQMTYMLPRLRGWGTALSRQAGGRVAGGAGIGGRGPGETQLEVDRRRIMRRIRKLKADLEDYERIRRTKSARRERASVPTVALVGYTNAGKSSLLNRLTESEVLVEDQLFATLDPTARQLELPDGRQVVLTDTVGFIRKLPTGLIEAFMSTLEESARADLLLHVVDASHPEAEAHIVAVREVLEEIGADELPQQLVLNKADAADRALVGSLARRIESELGVTPVVVSAHTGQGVEDLLSRLATALPGGRVAVSGTIPYDRHDLVAAAHEHGEVHAEEHGPEGTHLKATVDVEVATAMRPFLDVDPFAVELEDWER
ncbi:MAG: GTPase HflX [Actinomycetes bacterium]